VPLAERTKRLLCQYKNLVANEVLRVTRYRSGELMAAALPKPAEGIENGEGAVAGAKEDAKVELCLVSK
jgi:hypothetical protein